MAPGIIFFGHDAYDPAVQRRIAALERTGAAVRGFTMRRGAPVVAAWNNVDLGETRDAAFAQRIWALVRASFLLSAHGDALRAADVFIARNLDMLALAWWGKVTSGSRAALVYECLDIHRLMTRSDALGALARASERRLLGAVKIVVTSSPAFEREYFNTRHPGRARVFLIENRMPARTDYGERPIAVSSATGPLRIGWFGNLRCRRSLGLLLDLADRFPDTVQIHLRGAPALAELPDFETRVSGRENVRVGGRYRWPADLASIYAEVDLVWAGDFFDPGANSKWLLPNRLYEGGYYGAPPIAPADCETGRWIERYGAGFTLLEPLDRTLPELVAGLDRAAVTRARERLMGLPKELFVQPDEELRELLKVVLEAEESGA